MSQPMGLPINAWRNAKQYADIVFPGNPVVGDRILRVDEDTGRGGRWYTYIEVASTPFWVPDYLRDTVAVSGTANLFDIPVSFGITLPAPPSVNTNPPSGFVGYAKTTSRPVSVTATGFIYRLATTDGASVTLSGQIGSWIAIP